MNLNRLRPIRTAILMLLCCSHSFAQTDNTQSSTPQNSDQELSPAQQIKAEVQRLGVQYRMPAMFAAHQTIGQPLIGYAGGRRKRGSDVRVTLEDNTVYLAATTIANDEVGAGLDQIFEPMIRIRRDTSDSPVQTQ